LKHLEHKQREIAKVLLLPDPILFYLVEIKSQSTAYALRRKRSVASPVCQITSHHPKAYSCTNHS